MEFRIADTFTASLARLGGEDQKLVKTTAFDLQLNPGNPGHQFHRLDRAKDPRFWSVRVGRDIRLIVHRTDASLLVCYVDHHDDAYRWAERRKLETHPKTGAAQLVEIREVVRDVEAPRLFEAPVQFVVGLASDVVTGPAKKQGAPIVRGKAGQSPPRLAGASYGGTRAASAEVVGHRFTQRFPLAERVEIVDAWQLSTWEGYRDVRRLGRKTRLPDAQRVVLWSIFEAARFKLEAKALITAAHMFTALAGIIQGGRPPYDFVVVDEAQDVSIPQLWFLAAVAGDRPGALFFAGDLGQRIFQSPFSWLSLGVDVRGDRGR